MCTWWFSTRFRQNVIIFRNKVSMLTIWPSHAGTHLRHMKFNSWNCKFSLLSMTKIRTFSTRSPIQLVLDCIDECNKYREICVQSSSENHRLLLRSPLALSASTVVHYIFSSWTYFHKCRSILSNDKDKRYHKLCILNYWTIFLEVFCLL